MAGEDGRQRPGEGLRKAAVVPNRAYRATLSRAPERGMKLLAAVDHEGLRRRWR